jgi:plasmid stabilization system protein ParE
MANPKRQILWSPEAEADLLGIWNYLAREASPEIADGRCAILLTLAVEAGRVNVILMSDPCAASLVP